MLDLFAVFTRGGALLWTLQFTAAMRHNPVDALNALIKSCLLEERSAETTYTYVPKAGAHQAVKWTFHNGLGLVFVAVYQKALSLMYVDELLAAAKAEFVANHYKPNVYSYPGFNDTFQRLLRDAEARAEEAKKGGSRALQQQQQVGSKAAQSIHSAGAKGGRAGKTTTSSSTAAAANGIKGAASSGEDDEEGDAAGVNGAARASAANGGAGAGGAGAPGGASDEHSAGHSAEEDGGAKNSSSAGAFDLSKLPKGLSGSKGARGRGGGKALGAGGAAPLQGGASSGRLGKASAEEVKQKQAEGGKKPKAERKWGLRGALGAADASKLDFSDSRDPGHHSEYTAGSESDRQGFSDVDGPNSNHRLGSSAFIGESLMDRGDDDDVEDVVKSLEEQELLSNGKGAAAATAKAGSASKGLLGSFVSSLALRVVGKQALSAEDLAPALADMKRKLMERNVAEEIAQNICGSVARSLEGQKLASFTGVGTFVARAVEDALAGILNKRTVDMLLDIRKAQERGRPYVVVFCGVNGVGKSTNLAKIAYWLGQHNVKVLIAACDTFRAGAVEQLKTHCTRLQVPLYERGYEKDPAKVAAEAIKQAEREGRHVVLVDTAGRMQDNEPLMRALSNLINMNNPNLVLFVGEALVGNDAVDQLVKFNRALHDLAPPTATVRHVIDGIVLTKFDTIDDKVGAAVSMVYASGAPIMFLGCGQTYADLKRLNVKAVVNALLK